MAKGCATRAIGERETKIARLPLRGIQATRQAAVVMKTADPSHLVMYGPFGCIIGYIYIHTHACTTVVCI